MFGGICACLYDHVMFWYSRDFDDIESLIDFVEAYNPMDNPNWGEAFSMRL